MHFSKTYTKLLLTLPTEITQSAIPYRQLKKLIRAAVDEFASLGLRAAAPGTIAKDGPVASSSDHQEDQQAPTLVFEFRSSSSRVDRFSLVVTKIVVDDLPLPSSVKTNTISLPDTTTSASSASLGSEPDNSSVETLHETKQTTSGDVPASLSSAFLHSTGLIAASLHLPVPDGSPEVAINLIAETAFCQLLWTTSRALSAHLLTLYANYCDDLRSLSDDITASVRPRSSTSSFRPHSSTSDPNAISFPRFNDKKSDLYAWREIFQLYIDLSPFECLSEENRRERTAEESEKILSEFTGKIQEAGLIVPPKMKLKQSQDVLQRFTKLNEFILNFKRFQRLSVEAIQKILKKHAKRIPLPLPHLTLLEYIPVDPSQQITASSQHFTEFSLIPNSASSLTRVIVQTMGETLLMAVPHLDDYTCFICMSIAFKPIRLACGHFFCVRCLVKMQKRGQANCPMCRASTVLRANRSNVDWALVNFMQDWFPIETKAKHEGNAREVAEEQVRDLGYNPNTCIVT